MPTPSEAAVIAVLDDPASDLAGCCLRALPERAIRVLGSNLSALSPAQLAEVTVLLGDPNRLARVIPHCPKLEWAQSTWAGVAPLLALEKRDYLLTALKGVFDQVMSEFVLGWLLALRRGVLARAQSSTWDEQPEPGVAGMRVGIMGTGTIGTALARSLGALNMCCVGLNSDGRAVPGFEHCFATSERLHFADSLDVLIAVLPATAATDNLIDAALLARLNPGAIVMNVGRGNAVVDADLLKALDSGQVGHAVLDVFREEPLPATHAFWANERVFVTSHTAAPTPVSAAIAVFQDNLQRWEQGAALRYQVDFDRGY